MSQSNFKAQLVPRDHSNNGEISKVMRARDEVRTAYSGNENRGPAANQKTRSNDRTKSRRLSEKSGKTPIR